ncbi:MAG: hypothetical protein JF603_00990 [Acidobacteria bacterium]|nr:hypothetical protein [Acidobacteriota bacterium]
MRIDQAATAVQRWAALEERAFALLGGWVASTSSPALKVRLAEQSRHHGWRAGLWQELVPADYGLGATTAVAVAAMIDAAGDEARRERAAEVAQELLDDYRAALAAASPVSDGPMIRTLRRAIADVEVDVAAIASSA